ncbi:MAG: 2-C-methyl-D-erythritol 4-phosphate cytidylyltransferase [Duncaniella sp.]|nr:2-C-methyl-D-erythritol 4-phosphate cytidylyltransferase [Duncaniella sp.]
MNYQIIVAAGSGSRYGGDLPKQFCDLNGRPLLMTTIERLHCCDAESEVLVVLSEDMMEFWQHLCREFDFSVSHTVIAGGATRAHSVKNAIDYISDCSCGKGWISVHDAARPMVSQKLFDAIVGGLDGADGALPACRLSDSIRLVREDGSSEAMDRSRYRLVQTPQIFHADKLIDAYRQEIRPEFTDDASVMEAAGYANLRLVDGDPRNIKVTNPGDMAIAELYLSE